MSSSKAVLDNLFDGDDSSRRMDAAAQWLLRSIEACPVQGSAAFYSRFYRPSRGWGNPYPETTGYIVPTFLKYGQRSHRPEFISLALEMAQWIMSLQHEDGSLPGGFGGKPHKPSVFNTGQMIFGLLSAYRVSSEKSFLSAASRGRSVAGIGSGGRRQLDPIRLSPRLFAFLLQSCRLAHVDGLATDRGR